MKTAAGVVIYLLFNICALTTKAQTISSFTPQIGPVGSLVKITGSNLSNTTSVSIGGVSAIIISNNGANIVAMVMPSSVSGVISIINNTVTATTATNFVIASPDIPTTQQGPKLLGTGVVGFSNQGNAVAVSADGNTAIIGGYTDNEYQGAVWIYTRTNQNWKQQGKKLIGFDTIWKPQQGYSVAISADGNTAIVGGTTDNYYQGAAWIFTRNNIGEWLQQGKKLIGAGIAGLVAQQGSSVGISADGNTAIVGGLRDNNFQGAAWVFLRSNGVWKQYGNKLVGKGAVGNAQQGYAVAISADGNTLAVGGNTDSKEQGAVWIYTRIDSVWMQQGNKLSGTGGIDTAQQGSSISLNANGNTLIVAGGKDNKGKGAAWVFTRNGSQWSQQGNKLVSNDISGDTARIGVSVALNADGNIALIGGTNNDGSKGAALLFTREGTIWTQKNNQLQEVGNIPATNIGLAIAMSADASTIIIGSTADGLGPTSIFVKLPVPAISNFTPSSGTIGTLVKISGTNFRNLKTINIGGVSALLINSTDTSLVAMVMPGATTAEVNITTVLGSVKADKFLVIPTSFPSIQQGEKLIGVTGNAQLGYSVAISADGNTAVVGSKTNVFTYKRTDGVWKQDGNQLFVINLNTTQQSYSVAINADGTTVIVGGYADNANQGAAWVFTRTSGVWSQQGNKLVGTGAQGASQQGFSVAISADGNTAVIGGNQNNGGEGALWVFKRTAGVYSQEANLLAGGAIGLPQLGNSVAISADANTIVSGGNQDDKARGAAWVFIKNENGWFQRGPKLKANDAISTSNLGSSVSINADGKRIVVGGNKTIDGGAGAIVFDIADNGWSTSPLIGVTASNNIQFGKSVAISADGNTILVGAPLANNNKGAVWTFTKSNNEDWKEKTTILSGKNAVGNSLFGSSIALSADASTAFIGGPGDNTIGSTWAFRIASTNTNLNALTISAGTLSTNFSSSTTTYLTSVFKTTDSIAFTPTTADTAALIEMKINGGTKSIVKSGLLSNKVSLQFGKNLIEIIVTAEDQQTVKTYLITVTRFNQTVITYGTFNSFISCAGSPSTPQSIGVSGSGLSENIIVTAPAGFEISTKIDSVYTRSLSLLQTEGIVASTNIFTRMITSIAGTIFGNIIVSSTDATPQNIAISGIVNELPNVGPIVGAKQVCISSTTKFLNEISGGVWSSGKDSIATVNTDGLITPVKVGTATILYTVINANGCKKMVTRDIIVSELPTVNAITGIQQTCKDGSTVFSVTTTGGVWSSNNTSVASVIDAGLVAQVNGINLGIATITYTVNNVQGCETKVVRDITVYSKPLVSSVSGSGVACTGTTLLLSNSTTGGVWSIDSMNIATISSIGELVPIKEGIVNASYTVTNIGGCVSSVNKLITINKTPVMPVITIDDNLNLVSSSLTDNYWYKSPNITPIDGAIGKIFSPLLNGRYKVRINNANCHSDFSDEFVYITSPITMLYPNPVNSFVIAQLESENVKRIYLLLVDNSGNVIESKSILLNIGKNEIRFNTEKLVRGTYFIAIKNYKSSSKIFVK